MGLFTWGSHDGVLLFWREFVQKWRGCANSPSPSLVDERCGRWQLLFCEPWVSTSRVHVRTCTATIALLAACWCQSCFMFNPRDTEPKMALLPHQLVLMFRHTGCKPVVPHRLGPLKVLQISDLLTRVPCSRGSRAPVRTHRSCHFCTNLKLDNYCLPIASYSHAGLFLKQWVWVQIDQITNAPNYKLLVVAC